MKVTITNDEGGILEILTDVHLDTRKGRFVGTRRSNGEVTLVSGALHGATLLNPVLSRFYDELSKEQS